MCQMEGSVKTKKNIKTSQLTQNHQPFGVGPAPRNIPTCISSRE